MRMCENLEFTCEEVNFTCCVFTYSDNSDPRVKKPIKHECDHMSNYFFTFYFSEKFHKEF